MELQTLIFRRLTQDKPLAELLATYGDRPAVFYQRAASSDNPKWGEVQYPRIDYVVDLQDNPARNTSGQLTINVWCDTQYGAEPEEVEQRLRGILHSAFVNADDGTYCLGWNHSDAFEAGTEGEDTVHTIGITAAFDLIACPCNYTMYPDPIKAINKWTKSVLPDAIVIGEDKIGEWTMPTKGKPVVYWRLTAQDINRRHYTHTWLNINIEGHVHAKSAEDRLYNLVRLNTAQAVTGHVPMEDGSPLFINAFNVQPNLNYISVGQIRASGNFGVLQPESHYHNKYTGDPLNHANKATR